MSTRLNRFDVLQMTERDATNPADSSELESDFQTVLRCAKEIDPEFYDCCVGRWSHKICKILKEDKVWDSIIALADALYDSGNLDAESVERIIRDVVLGDCASRRETGVLQGFAKGFFTGGMAGAFARACNRGES